MMKGISLRYLLSLAFLGLSLGENHEYIRTRDNNDINNHTTSGYHLFGADPTTKRCGTRDLNERDHAAFLRAQAFAKFKAERQHLGVFEEITATTLITIPVCFHNPEYSIPLLNRHSHRYITNEELQAELIHLNRAYSAASCCDTQQSWCTGNCSVDTMIRFTMAKIDANNQVIGTTPFTTDPNACIKRPRGHYYMSMNQFFDKRKKRKQRIGDETILNIYFTKPKAIPFLDLLAYSTMPWEYDDNPERDGVVIDPSVRHGGRRVVYNEGDSVVHEIGHWLGLYHTFKDGCEGEGDKIDDTPAEAKSNFGCKPSENRDTCPTQPGLDPIHNFMDLSYDVCLFLFTAGQAAALRNNVALYRTPAARMVRRSTMLSNGVSSDSYSLQSGMVRQFSLEVPVKAFVSCQVSSTTTTEGVNLDLFMNWDGDLANFDCSAETAESVESCTLDPNSGTAYAYVLAVTDVSDFSITCETI